MGRQRRDNMSIVSVLISLSLSTRRFSRIPLGGGSILLGLPLFLMVAVAATHEGIPWAKDYANYMAFIWLALAPDFIRLGKSALDKFGDESFPLFKSTEVHAEYMNRTRNDVLSNKFLVVGIPLALCTGALLWLRYDNLPILTRATQAIFYSILIFCSGIGWWAIGVLINSIGKLDSKHLKIDPFHWDGFGGYRCCGTLAVKWCTLFFSGSLLFPKILDILQGSSKSNTVSALAYLLPLGFICIGAIGFFYSQFLVRELVALQKKRELLSMKTALDSAYREVLSALLGASALTKENFDALKNYHDFFYLRVIAIRAWPFDYKVILQLITSALVPITMAGLEISKRWPSQIGFP